ncbi:MAG: acetyl-CoA carboxylase, carboxyltransferase subunit beta [Rhodospirillales bacterium]
MNWLRDYVRPKLQNLVGGQKEIPENLWRKCPKCGEMIFHRDLEINLHVCQHCGHHMRINTEMRLGILFDEGDYELLPEPETPQDPLKFRDRERYTDRLKRTRAKTGREDAVAAAMGRIGGQKAVVALQDFSFMGGSLGVAAGEAFIEAAHKAVETGAPLIAVTCSGGARMQEGVLSLMQLPRTTVAVEHVKNAGLPYIVLMTDPTTGGVSASFAMLGDVQIAEPGAVIGFAGRRVIEQTIREDLPEDFQTAEYLLEHGMLDMVVRRADLRETLGRIIALLMDRPPESAGVVKSPDGPGGAAVTDADTADADTDADTDTDTVESEPLLLEENPPPVSGLSASEPPASEPPASEPSAPGFSALEEAPRGAQ